MIRPFSTFFISVSLAIAAIASPVKSNLGADGTENSDVPESTAQLYVQDGLIAMWDAIENAGWGIRNPNGFPVNLVTGEYDIPFEKFRDIEIHPSALVIRGETTVMSTSYFSFNAEPPYMTGEWNIAMMREDNTTTSLDIWTTFGNDFTAPSLNLYLYSSKVICARGNNYFAYSSAVGSGEWADGVFTARVSVNKSSDAGYNLAEYFVDGVLKYSTSRSNWVFGTYFIKNPARLLIRVKNNSVMVIRNIRLYNRALSPDEISYNYSIDQMRFGI